MKVAYGGHFREELDKRPQMGVATYAEHLFSKYIDFADSGKLFRSSYEWQNPIATCIFKEYK